MDSKVALLIGFLIGVVAAVGGMVLTGMRDRQHVIPPVVTNIAAKGIVEAAREKNSRGPNWWGMDAPTLSARDIAQPRLRDIDIDWSV